MTDRTPGWRPAFRLPFGARRVEVDVDDEIAFHLAMREEGLRARGLAPDDAREAARRRFGDVERIRDECAELGRRRAARSRRASRLDALVALWAVATWLLIEGQANLSVYRAEATLLPLAVLLRRLPLPLLALLCAVAVWLLVPMTELFVRSRIV
jgi:hypothetical protein